MKFLGSTKVRAKGQITVPKKAREMLNLKKRDYLLFYLNKNQKIVVKKA